MTPIPDHIIARAERLLHGARRAFMRDTFTGTPTRLDRAGRRVCEWALDRIEMWECREAFARLEAEAAEAEAAAEELKEVLYEFRIGGRKPGDENDTRR